MATVSSDRPQIRFSKNDSLNSNDIIDVMHPQNTRADWLLGWCRSDVLTDTGKRLQIFKILVLILVPILGLWSFTVYGLFGSLELRSQMEQTQMAVRISVGIGKVLDKIQRERDMSVLYLSILGPQTKTFLRNEYLLTDQALDQLTSWPLKTAVKSAFHSKDKFQRFLNKHRQSLSSKNFDIYVEIAFYNSLIEPFVEWLYDAITESNKASMWQILVSYQKIVTGIEQIGIERALGVVFFVNGGFPSKTVYETYNRNVNIFKSNYRSAVLYSKEIDAIFQTGMLKSGTNLTAVIEKFRYEIQHSVDMQPSVIKGQWWFDNMTLYLDTLFVIQQDLALIINDEVEIIITEENNNLTISGILLFVVFLMCPLVVYFVQALTGDIQTYAQILVNKTKELHREMRKTNTLLYQMVPRSIADKLKNNESIDAEYFKFTTIMSTEVAGFMDVTLTYTPLEIVELLNTLYAAFDDQMVKYNVYRVETIGDSYTIVSGLPVQIGNKHSLEIGHLALDFLNLTKTRQLFNINNQHAQIRIGVNTGSCMAGVIGNFMPRYCIFGDSVKTASRMKMSGMDGKIHLSNKAYNSMKNHNIFIMSERGQIQIKKKGVVKTYWLEDRHDIPEDVIEIPSSTIRTGSHNIVGGITECSEAETSQNPLPSTSFQSSVPEQLCSTLSASGGHDAALQHEEEFQFSDPDIPESNRAESSDKATPFCLTEGRGRAGEDKHSATSGKQHDRATSSQTAGSHELPGEILECYATDPQSTINIHCAEPSSYVRGKDYSRP